MTNTDRDLLAILIEASREAVYALREGYRDETGEWCSPEPSAEKAADDLDRAILNFELKSKLLLEVPHV